MDKEVAKIRAKLDILEQELKMVALIAAATISEKVVTTAENAFNDYEKIFKDYCGKIDKGEQDARD